MRYKEQKEEVPEPLQPQVQQTHKEDLLPERANSCGSSTAKMWICQRGEGRRGHGQAERDEGERKCQRRKAGETQMKEGDRRRAVEHPGHLLAWCPIAFSLREPH